MNPVDRRPDIISISQDERHVSKDNHFRNEDNGDFSNGVVYVVRKKVTNGPTRVGVIGQTDTFPTQEIHSRWPFMDQLLKICQYPRKPRNHLSSLHRPKFCDRQTLKWHPNRFSHRTINGSDGITGGYRRENKIIVIVDRSVYLVLSDRVSVAKSKEIIVRTPSLTGIRFPGLKPVSYVNKSFHSVTHVINRIKNTFLGITIWVREYVHFNFPEHS